MNSKIKTLFAAAGLAVALAGAATGASAATPWQIHHPARVEVNARLERQNLRIRQERRLGEFNAMQAHRLHAADQRILARERWFAVHHRGHLTRLEQARLNQRENRVSRHIG
jgi:hypothetical protein